MGTIAPMLTRLAVRHLVAAALPLRVVRFHGHPHDFSATLGLGPPSNNSPSIRRGSASTTFERYPGGYWTELCGPFRSRPSLAVPAVRARNLLRRNRPRRRHLLCSGVRVSLPARSAMSRLPAAATILVRFKIQIRHQKSPKELTSHWMAMTKPSASRARLAVSDAAIATGETQRPAGTGPGAWRCQAPSR